MTIISSLFDHSLFNALPSLSEATEKFAVEKEKSLTELFKVIRRHKLEDFVGVQLLHGHFRIKKGEILVEKSTGELESVAKAAPASEIKSCYPTVFKAVRDSKSGSISFAPLEFAAGNGSAFMEKLSTQEDFLLEFGSKVLELGLESVIGFGFISASVSNMLKSNGKMDGRLIVESTDLKSRANIKTLMSPDERTKLMKRVGGSLDETWWSADPSLSLQETCFQYCPKENDGSHSRFHGH